MKTIIDGVNVAECISFVKHEGTHHQGYWEYNDICYGFEFELNCADNPNCKYKQFQRTKQKLEIAEQALRDITNIEFNDCVNCSENIAKCNCKHCKIATTALNKIGVI